MKWHMSQFIILTCLWHMHVGEFYVSICVLFILIFQTAIFVLDLIFVTSECERGWIHWGISCYYFSNQKLSWVQAEVCSSVKIKCFDIMLRFALMSLYGLCNAYKQNSIFFFVICDIILWDEIKLLYLIELWISSIFGQTFI